MIAISLDFTNMKKSYKNTFAIFLYIFLISCVVLISCEHRSPKKEPQTEPQQELSNYDIPSADAASSSIPSAYSPQIPLYDESASSAGVFTIVPDITDFGQTFNNLIIFWNPNDQTGEVLVFDAPEGSQSSLYSPPVNISRYAMSDIKWVWDGTAKSGTFELVETGITFFFQADNGELRQNGKEWMLWCNRMNVWAHLQTEHDGAGGRLYGYSECLYHENGKDEWVFYGNNAGGYLYLAGGIITEFNHTDTETILWAKQIRDEAFAHDNREPSKTH
ncbi:MAG: hypothetical protein IJC15_08850 [Clostridia bacterium]|nr:hypothetical protein [Clostridia bacterium]